MSIATSGYSCSMETYKALTRKTNRFVLEKDNFKSHAI